MPVILQNMLFATGVFLIALIGAKLSKPKQVSIGKELGYTVINRPNILFAALVAAVLIIVSGDRGFAFSDTGSYTFQYENYLKSNFTDAWNEASESKAFWGLAGYIKGVSGADKGTFLMVFAVITIGLVFISFYRNSEGFEITVFMFVTLGSYLVTMNAMRQCIASAIMFIGYRLFMNKKWYLFFILVGIAYFFHPTALIMIPIYFYCHRPPWSKFLTAAMVLAVLVLTFVPSAANAIFGALGDTKYSQYDSMNGANIGRPLTMLVICVLAYKNREQIKIMFPDSDVLVNMLLIHTVMLFAATNSWIFARLTIYTDLYVEMFIPMLIYAGTDKRNRTLYTALIMIFFLAYHLYEYRNLDYYSKTLGINY